MKINNKIIFTIITGILFLSTNSAFCEVNMSNYDSVQKISEHYSIVTQNGKKGVLKGEEELVVPTVHDDIQAIGNERYILIKDGKKGLMYYGYHVVAPIEYDDIQVVNDYYCLLIQNNKRVLLRDEEIIGSFRADDLDFFIKMGYFDMSKDCKLYNIKRFWENAVMARKTIEKTKLSVENQKKYLVNVLCKTYKHSNSLDKIIYALSIMEENSYPYIDICLNSVNWDDGNWLPREFKSAVSNNYYITSMDIRMLVNDISNSNVPELKSSFQKIGLKRQDLSSSALDWLKSEQNCKKALECIDNNSINKDIFAVVLNSNNIPDDKKISVMKSVQRYQNYSDREFLLSSADVIEWSVFSLYGGVTIIIPPILLCGYVIPSRLNREVKKPLFYMPGMLNSAKLGLPLGITNQRKPFEWD